MWLMVLVAAACEWVVVNVRTCVGLAIGFLLHVKYTLLYGMAMTVSSLVHWPLMGGLLHLTR